MVSHKIMSSTAFPNVTFMRDPIVSPMSLATLSVAYASSPASGIMAIAFIANTIFPFTPAKWTATPTGTKIKRTLSQVENSISLHTL